MKKTGGEPRAFSLLNHVSGEVFACPEERGKLRVIDLFSELFHDPCLPDFCQSGTLDSVMLSNELELGALCKLGKLYQSLLINM